MNMQAKKYPHLAHTSPPNYLDKLNLSEAKYLWYYGHKKGVIQDKPQELPLPRIIEYLRQQPYNELIMAVADNPKHIAYTIMEKMIAKPIYMCARGETSIELYDSRNRPIVTPRGQYREIPYTTPLRFAREFDTRLRANKAQVDNRIVVEMMPNPKKPGTAAHEHYTHYQQGKSVSWHIINTDLTRADIRYDIKRGFIKVLTPAEYTAQKTA